MIHPEASAILSELGITVVPPNVAPQPGETRAIASVQKIVRRHGYEHARLVMMTLKETTNNQGAMDKITIGATSDVIMAFRKNYPGIMDSDMERFFAFFDGIPLGALEALYCRGLDGIVSKRAALSGQIWERAVRVFGSAQLDLLDDRRSA